MTSRSTDRTDRPSALIIGGGIIGCAAALELTKAGFQCTVTEKNTMGCEASSAAAGMLGAQVETHYPGPFYDLCRASLHQYEDWVAEIKEISGIDPEYIAKGILRVAFTEEDERELRSRLPWIKDAAWMDPASLRSMEAALPEDIRGGFYLEKDHQLQPTALTAALKGALLHLGCRIHENTPTYRLLLENGRVIGAITSSGPMVADVTIVAAGAWSTALTEPIGLSMPVFPVKGQCLSVRPETPLTRHTVFTQGCYIVPKQDGTALIGATQHEAGFDKQASFGTIAELYARASRLLPGISEAAFVRTWAGLRPGTKDGLPYLGTCSHLPGFIAATGHYRNGILLAPVTGVLVKQLALGEQTLLDLSPYSPDRQLLTV